MSPITRSKTSLIRWRYPDFPTFQDLEEAYKIAYPKIQYDAKQLLEMMIDEQDIRKNFYNPTSPEYWFINNKEALEEVVYYKMKKRLIIRYKTQLIEKGVDLSEYSDTESEFGGELPPTLEELLYKEEDINTQRQKNLIKGKLHGTVKAQVQEFIDQEISRVSKGLIENTDEDNDFIGFVRTQLNEVFQEQLEVFMDGSSADFALYTGGGRIIHQLTSRNYELWPSKSYQKLLSRFTNSIIKSKNPETVISPNVNVGDCWCFNGTKGQIAIKLSRSIVLTHVTYQHISREVSIDPILSAPYEFELWGLPTSTSASTGGGGGDSGKGEVELEEKNSLGIFKNDFKFFLGSYQYDINGSPTQTFTLPDSIAKSNKRINAIMMRREPRQEQTIYSPYYYPNSSRYNYPTKIGGDEEQYTEAKFSFPHWDDEVQPYKPLRRRASTPFINAEYNLARKDQKTDYDQFRKAYATFHDDIRSLQREIEAIEAACLKNGFDLKRGVATGTAGATMNDDEGNRLLSYIPSATAAAAAARGMIAKKRV
ncbi:15450_t:CDS:2 [Rhizophagus irregularis]|nr:15450_t:CDS:2 [Rhizophagus irregularis]